MNEEELSRKDRLIGKNLKDVRKQKGFSVDDLASQTGIAKEIILKYENGDESLNIHALISICETLRVSSDVILCLRQDSSSEGIQKKDKEASRLKSRKYSTFKAWLIIGCILTPLAIGGSIIGASQGQDLTGLIALALYVICIPLCFLVLRQCREATNRYDLIAPGIISLFFVSIIGGLLLFFAKDDDFEVAPVDEQMQIKPKEDESVIDKKDRQIEKHNEQKQQERNEEIKNAPLTKKQKISLITFALLAIGAMALALILGLVL